MIDCPKCREHTAVRVRDGEWICLDCGFTFDSHGRRRELTVTDYVTWEAMGKDVPV